MTDSSVVAHHVDGVLLVVRTSRSGRPVAERARNILDTLGAKILGVVVNAVEKNGVAGYGYGYGYGYGTAYGKAASKDVINVNSPQGETAELVR